MFFGWPGWTGPATWNSKQKFADGGEERGGTHREGGRETGEGDRGEAWEWGR
jgi:hypothetical protein